MSLIKDAPPTVIEQLKSAMIENAKLKARIKLMRDRANFALEFAEGAENDFDQRTVIHCLKGQHQAIVADSKDLLL